MTLSPEERPTASEALQNPWFKIFTIVENSSQEELFTGLTNLKVFHTQMTFQKAVLSYIASQELNKDEEKKLKEIFDSIDSDKNGSISKEELIEGYKLMDGNDETAENQADYVMHKLDLNKNGTIDYNEFLMANLTRHSLSKQRLKKAFKYFDHVW